MPRHRPQHHPSSSPAPSPAISYVSVSCPHFPIRLLHDNIMMTRCCVAGAISISLTGAMQEAKWNVNVCKIKMGTRVKGIYIKEKRTRINPSTLGEDTQHEFECTCPKYFPVDSANCCCYNSACDFAIARLQYVRHRTMASDRAAGHGARAREHGSKTVDNNLIT